MLSLTRTVFALLLTSVAVVALVACGGKSEDKGPPAPSRERADLMAHTALVEAPDLSGDWLLFTTDNFRNDDSGLLDNGNCAAARKLAGDMAKANISRAQRALQQVLPGYNSRAQVEMQVRIFDKASTAQDYLKRHRAVLTGDAYVRCLQDGFAAQFGGSNASVKSGEAHAKAPRDGVAAAFYQDLRVDNQVYELYTDSYAWVQDNAYVLLLFSGPRGLDSNDLIKLALERVQQKMDASLKLP
jgi:hypothetical protein